MPDAALRTICCDTCPLDPTCEEENQFLADIGLAPKWGEEYDDYPDRGAAENAP